MRIASSLLSLSLLTAALIGAAEPSAVPAPGTTTPSPTEVTTKEKAWRIVPVAAPAGYETVELPYKFNGRVGTVKVHRVADQPKSDGRLTAYGVRLPTSGALIPPPWSIVWDSRWVRVLDSAGQECVIGQVYWPIVRDGAGRDHDGNGNAWAVVMATETLRPTTNRNNLPDLTDWVVVSAYTHEEVPAEAK